jgi:RimJ/RimL family protein N-acetyltransferase
MHYHRNSVQLCIDDASHIGRQRRRLESLNGDGLADVERHQVLTHHQGPAVDFPRLGDNVIYRRRRNSFRAKQNKMRVGRELRLGLGENTASLGRRRVMPERHGGVEIGVTFLRPDVRASFVNPEAKMLMPGHAFDSGAGRVQFTVDVRNTRSQAAVAKLGAVREGVLRQDTRTWSGHIRDTVVFSILDSEWPTVKLGLERRLME